MGIVIDVFTTKLPFQISSEKVSRQQKTTCNTKKCSIRHRGNNYFSIQVVVARLDSGLSQVGLTNRNDAHKFESALKSRFAQNRITGARNPYYPDKLLGHGCAEWAVNNSIRFVDEFCRRLGIDSRFDHVREKLDTK